MIVTLTGHRPTRLGGYGRVNPIRDELKKRLRAKFAELGISRWEGSVYLGLSQGFDWWGAEVCMDDGIPFIGAIPFEGFEREWPESAQKWFRFLRSKAERIHVQSKAFSMGAFHLRNEWMVDRCDQVVTALDQQRSGGTFHTVQYAEAKGKAVHNLWTPELQALLLAKGIR